MNYVQSLTWFFSSHLQVVLKGDPKKLSLHGVRINLWTDFHHLHPSKQSHWRNARWCHWSSHLSLALSPPLFCLSHSRHAPCVWRTSKWKTSWECCHANMPSTGSEHNYQSFSLLFFSSRGGLVWADLRPRWMESILTAAAAGAPVCQHWHLRMKEAAAIVTVLHVHSWWKQWYDAGKHVRMSASWLSSEQSHTHFRQSCQTPRVL